MKKIHKVLIVVAVALAGAIAGTVFVVGAAEAPMVSQTVDYGTEEVMGIYPGYVESLKAPQTQATGITTEEVMGIYPGYVDSLKASQTRAPGISTADIMGIYPGYVDSLKASQTRAPVTSTADVMGIYRGYPESLEEYQSQSFENVLKQLPYVPGIYFHP